MNKENQISVKFTEKSMRKFAGNLRQLISVKLAQWRWTKLRKHKKQAAGNVRQFTPVKSNCINMQTKPKTKTVKLRLVIPVKRTNCLNTQTKPSEENYSSGSPVKLDADPQCADSGGESGKNEITRLIISWHTILR